MESTVTRILVTTELKRLVNGPCWNLNWFYHCSLAVATECFGLLRNQSVSIMPCSERQDRCIFLRGTESGESVQILCSTCRALVR